MTENIPILPEAFLLLQSKVDGTSFSGNVSEFPTYYFKVLEKSNVSMSIKSRTKCGLFCMGLNENEKKKKNMVKP